jgi:hypothetical protein
MESHLTEHLLLFDRLFPPTALESKNPQRRKIPRGKASNHL